MTKKIHPNAISGSRSLPHPPPPPTTIPRIFPSIGSPEEAAVLTVWKKSLLFNCSGFTVFDSKGNLVFRVDNYDSGICGATEIVLMDSAGAPLVSIRRKRLSLGETWTVHAGEESANPILSVTKQRRLPLLQSKVLARVTMCGGSAEGYVVEGSYGSRCCRVCDRRGVQVAEVRRKETVGGVGFGNDVFRLVVDQSLLDSTVAMALVILLEQMFGSRV